MVRYYLILFCSFLFVNSKAQNNATFRETTQTYLTYPFSDPDPIPSTKKIYPYFRFDGFSMKGVNQDWKVVMLENDYIKVQIMPEIGGKVWTAMDKKSGKYFLYNNEVVKFRDIAMRGPWVSGGIEANYGIIGHTPNSATPVDYLVRSNSDGSVSCFTSTLDLLTRTRWILEIKLEKDKAYFSTQSYWFNSSGFEQPYYTWMNAGIPVGNGLRFLYPGNHYIGHGGEAGNFPMDNAGHNLSYYSQNNFSGSKSYHVLGVHSNFFGALWEGDDFGMIHYSKREDKLGKKIFLWAQSESGKIWEDLLTDKSGQYVEIQSGRLFNQNTISSSFTPFKQIGFAPFSSDKWIEYWYPFKGIDGFTGANLIGAFNVIYSGDSVVIKISPVQPILDSLFVFNKEGNKITATYIEAKPLEAIESVLILPRGEKAATIQVKGFTLDLMQSEPVNELSRPLVLDESFKLNEAYGLYLQGRDLARFRDYQGAESKIAASLVKDPAFLPALVEMGKLKIFCLQYDSAFYFLKKALSIDTYDGEANYYYGMAASDIHRNYDALDGFEVASLTPQFRNAAYTELSHQYLKKNDFAKAKDYALLSLKNNPDNLDAIQICYLLARINKDAIALEEARNKIERIDPLNHFLRFEIYLHSMSEADRNNFVKLIRNEMPAETFLELAIWYANLGRLDESRKVLQLAPQNTETLFWLAWLSRKQDISLSKDFLNNAAKSLPAFVFPFREETAKVLEWASHETKDWQPDYLLALIYDFRGNRKEALAKLEQHQEEIDFAPFYLLRARLFDSSALISKLENVEKAIKIDPDEWRYGIIQSEILFHLKKKQEALNTIEHYYNANKSNYIVGLNFIKSLIINEKYNEAERLLSTLHVLPFEGASDARKFYRETKLILAAQAIGKSKFKVALKKIDEAMEWPKRLGVGKPYQESIDENLENWMKGYIYKKMGNATLSQSYFERVKDLKINEKSYVDLIRSISSKGDERLF